MFDRLRRREPEIVVSICDAMVTGETSFFRNPSAFERLRRTVFPALLAARAAERRLRIWSAGCSTGQEPYCLAIALLEHFPEIMAWDVRIHATDVSAPVLRQAELGAIRRRRSAGGSTTACSRVFHAGRGAVVGRPEVRKLVWFERHNLLDPPRFGVEFDLILIRNVLIYLAAECRARVFSTLRRSIRDDGFLFLGESETILGQGDDFTFAEGGMDYYRPSRI